MKTERPGALLVIGDPLLGSHAKRIVELSTRNQLPAIYWTREFPDGGGLIAIHLVVSEFARLETAPGFGGAPFR